MRKRILLTAFLLAIFTFILPTANAQEKGYQGIVNHLKTKYQAKKVKIPFMWLAKLVVKVARPAGVKSFNVTLFENLKFSAVDLDKEMQAAMKDSLGEEWSPIMRVRSPQGEQVYFYMRDEGENVRLMLVAIDKTNATVIRAKFNADKFVEFLNNPKMFGISLGEDKQTEPEVKKSESEKKPSEVETQPTEQAKTPEKPPQ